jgi:hypothetical protein
MVATIVARGEHDARDSSLCYPPRVVASQTGELFVRCGCDTYVTTLIEQVRPADPVTPGLELIDPSQIYTPEDLERHLLDVVRRLELGQLFERECIEEEYAARLAWELAKAKTVAKAGGAADVRAALALTENQAEFERWQTAEMMRKAAQAAMHNLRSVLSGYQSVGKSVTATYGAGGSPSGRM